MSGSPPSTTRRPRGHPYRPTVGRWHWAGSPSPQFGGWRGRWSRVMWLWTGTRVTEVASGTVTAGGMMASLSSLRL